MATPPSALRRLALVPREGLPASASLTLEAAFRQYAPYVARIGTRILGRDDDGIDDLVQDVFTRAAAGLKRMTEAEEVRGWLATVTVRVAVRQLRLRRLRRLLPWPSDDRPAGEPVAADASAEARAMISAVYRLLDRLPARERAAWVLRHVEGERLEVVAQRCGCSLATAKRLIARAERAIELGTAERSTRDV